MTNSDSKDPSRKTGASARKPAIGRRRFLTTGGTAIAAAAAAAPLATPAIAQGTIRWRMVTSWPRNLPGPGVHAQIVADRIAQASGGRLEVELLAAGELVPGDGVFDAVSEGTAEMYHSVPAYWGSKSPGFLLFGSQPFGLRADEQVGWLAHGGGQALYDEIYGRFGLKGFLSGNTGPQWAGWFRNEIHSVDDLRGLRFRTTGLASRMCSKLGMAVQAMSGAAMFQALQTGAIDAGEFIGPWTDSALGYHQVAKFLYWPGVGEPSSAEEVVCNREAFDALPADLQQVIQGVAEARYLLSWMEYATMHARALPQLVAEAEVQVRELPTDVMEAMGDAAGEVMAELREDSDELVRRIIESFLAYRSSIDPYMVYADAGILNARRLNYSFPS